MSSRVRRRDAIRAAVASALLPAASLPFAAARAAAPLKGPLRPQAYRFRLGTFELTALFDGMVAMDGPHPIFGADQSPQAVARLCEENFLPTGRLAIGFAPILVNTGRQLVLFDAGNPASRREAGAGFLVDALFVAGYRPEEIDLVALTHYHPDHIGGLVTDGQPTFPNAVYASSAVEHAFWSAEERLSGPTEATARLVRTNVLPLADRLRLLQDGEELVPGIRALATPGHTPGHMAFHVESEGHRLLIWGDVANHFVLSVERPEWHVRFDRDKVQAAATRKRVFDIVATDRIPVAGYHMPFPNLGYVERRGGDYRWVRASYQFDV